MPSSFYGTATFSRRSSRSFEKSAASTEPLSGGMRPRMPGNLPNPLSSRLSTLVVCLTLPTAPVLVSVTALLLTPPFTSAPVPAGLTTASRVLLTSRPRLNAARTSRTIAFPAPTTLISRAAGSMARTAMVMTVSAQSWPMLWAPSATLLSGSTTPTSIVSSVYSRTPTFRVVRPSAALLPTGLPSLLKLVSCPTICSTQLIVNESRSDLCWRFTP